MNWKKAVSVMLVGIMALSMTACGDSGETSTDAASGGGSTAESTEGAGTSASGDDKLVVWTLSNDLIDFGERFEEQTGVAVDTVVIEPANYPTKVQSAFGRRERTGYYRRRAEDAGGFLRRRIF